MAATTAEAVRADSQDGKFWKVPLPPTYIHFVSSAESEELLLLFWALRNATVVAMDAEWKPVYNKSANAGSPRVSILQIACRLKDEEGGCQLKPDKGEKGANRCRHKNDECIDQERRERNLATASNPSPVENGAEGTESCDSVLLRGLKDQAGKGSSHVRKTKSGEGDSFCYPRGRRIFLERIANGVEWPRPEVIFILDLLAVPASAFGKVLKDVMVDPTVLKLGFGFKQDLINLRSTFPGPDSHCCFDKVDPYLDVGKLYRHLHENTSSFMHRGKKIVVGGDGLASIAEEVLGLPLSKDMQCSNWEQRPLSEQQYDYAAADAYCLIAIFDALQVKASDSWFAPSESEVDEVAEESQSKVGVAELLCPPGPLIVKGGNSYGGSASICQPKRGNAANMVEAALSSSSRKEPEGYKKSGPFPGESKILNIEKLMKRFGEKLIITGRESSSNKRVRRKSRSCRAREHGKGKDVQDEEDVQWVGPPPWDISIGGDGVPKFLCDAMVEGLARQLRCVGIDAASPNSKKCEPRELVDIAEKEGRILLTRDAKLLRRRLVPASLAYRVKRQGKWDQLAEVIEIFKLSISEEQLLTRCTKCNGDFIPKALNGEEAVAQAPWSQVIPACALSNVDEFWQCSVCKHVYWQGYQFTRAYKQFAAVCQADSSVVQD
ncbi:hypothetical protein Mapa_000917 [Marchantia paleacea]|nr:hypothetical protein Mapa_000917 [Marchantia paleacea]